MGMSEHDEAHIDSALHNDNPMKEERERWAEEGRCPVCGGEFDLPDPPYGGLFGNPLQCRSCGYRT